eukprot:540998-Pelagomonas_calceolata.AAC.1
MNTGALSKYTTCAYHAMAVIKPIGKPKNFTSGKSEEKLRAIKMLLQKRAWSSKDSGWVADSARLGYGGFLAK